MSTDRGYQAALIAALNAELGGRGISRAQMLKVAGLSADTMQRVFRLERDLNVAQLAAMADALGVTPEYIADRAREWREKQSDTEAILRESTLDEARKQAIRNDLIDARAGDDNADHDSVQSPHERRSGAQGRGA